MRLKLLACEILYREFCWVIAKSVNQVDVEFLPKGLHDAGREVMSQKLRAALASVDQANYDAVLMGYGLCSNGLVGLNAGAVPLVIPRAHDCITLFLGDKQRYLDYFYANTGTYFKTSGWIERGNDLNQLGSQSIQDRSGMNQSYDDLVEKYGEDNAQFLWEQLSEMTRNYGRLTFIEMGVEPNDSFERHAQQLAKQRNWIYEKVAGDMTLIRRLVDGPWDEDQFLVVPPGHQVSTSFDDAIIQADTPKNLKS